MVHVKSENGKITCKMVGHSEDLFIELAYAVAKCHIQTIIKAGKFDLVKDKEAIIRGSVEAFGDLLRFVLEEMYDRSVYGEHSVEDLQ